MKTNNQNPSQQNQPTDKTAAQSINNELHSPVDEKPTNVLRSWQNLRQLDNNLANKQDNDLPVD